MTSSHKLYKICNNKTRTNKEDIMGLLKDIKQEWTWEGFKKSMREEWPILLSVFIAGFLTPPCLKWLGKEDSTLLFFVVNVGIFLLACICLGLVMGLKRRIKK